MTNDEIRAVLDRFRQAWESRDMDTMLACYADDCVVVSPIFSTLNGRSQVEKSYTNLMKAFHTERIKVADVVIGTGDPPRAVIIWNMESTQIGEVFGMPPSGKKIEVTVAFILTLRNGVITKETRVYDFTSMLMQLGALKAKPAH